MYRSYKRKINIPLIIKIDDGELNNIGRYLKEVGIDKIALFYSEGIGNIIGDGPCKSFMDSETTVIHTGIVSDIDIKNIVNTAFSIPKEIEAIVAIGGGKAIDYAKYCAHILALPFISIPGSISNDGFCSPFSSLTLDGKKQTINSTIPFGVIVDLNLIKSAPESLIFSGIGDLVSKITAGHDWVQATKKNGLPISDFAYLISQTTVSDILECYYGGINDIRFLRHLATSLLMNGISMEIASSSRPASGSEHLICHALDRISKNPGLHGLQVGLSTYLCAYLQNNRHVEIARFLDSVGFFDYLHRNPVNKEEFIEAVRLAPTVKENFYTILSEPDSVARAIEFIEKDQILQDILR